MTLQENSVSTVGPRQLQTFFFCTIIFKMASTSYNAEDILQLLEEDNSEFPDSVSSGKGDEVYPHSGPSFSADNQNTAALTQVRRKISDHGKFLF